MAQTVFEVDQLLGQDRNRVRGQAQAPLQPTEVFNLVPHRAGGYTPYGYTHRLQDPLLTDVTLFNIARLIGHDETGISSYYETTSAPQGVLQLFRGTTIHDQAYPAYTDAYMAVHLDNAGAYLARDQYLVLDRENRRMEPIHVGITPRTRVGPPTQGQQVGSGAIGHFRDIEHGDGTFIAVSDGGYIYRSRNKGGNWEEVLGDAGVAFFSVAYSAGRWVAGTDNGIVYWSSDDGDTWMPVTVGGGWVSSAVSAGGGLRFFFAGAPVGDEPGIFRSLDGGENWTLIETTSPGVAGTSVGRVAYDAEKQLFVAQSSDNPYHYYSMTGGDNFALGRSGLLNTPTEISPGEGWVWIESIGPDNFVTVNAPYQRVARGVFRAGPLLSTMLWQENIALDGTAWKVKFNRVRNTIVVVGGGFAGLGARVWQGPTVGSLSRQSEIEEAFFDINEADVPIYSVAFDGDGDAVYVGRNGSVVTTGAGTGLRRGTYNMWFVSYFNTRAGRFVFDLRRESLSFSSNAGNEIDVFADSQESIIDNNPWLSALDPALAAAIVGDLRVDTYIQFVPQATGIGNEDISTADMLAEHTIRYAFTSPFPEEGEEAQIGRPLDALPIGRQIVQNGLPTTVVFEMSRTVDEASNRVRSRTAIHNGRIWGLAAQDEDRWAVESDRISPEIANQFNRFVLTYTETGWANLISDQSFIPIQPRQSSNFTGIISSPNGLLVMFDNEIWVVNGDPAFNNLVVELYMDLIGCDLGSPPCAVGGVVFVVWGGKVWAVQAGQASDISITQWRREDPFVHVAPEPQTRSILALTSSGRLFRYLVDDQFWMTDASTTLTGMTSPVREILPNCVCITGDNTRFVRENGHVWTSRVDGAPDTPHLLYENVDFGAPDRRTPIYLMKATVEGPWATAQYDRSAGGFNPAVLPRVFYGADMENNTSGQGILPVRQGVGARGVANLSWRFPVGGTRSPSINLRILMGGMSMTDVLKLPMRIFHGVGGQVR